MNKNHFLFDSHSHIQFPIYDRDRDEVIKRAQGAGVKMIAVGTQFSASQSAIGLAGKYPDDIWATVGYHPNHLSESWHHDKKEQTEPFPEVFNAEKFLALAKNSKVAAIGECGLDYYYLPADTSAENRQKKRQQAVFEEQIKIAEKLKKTLMIHCRSTPKTDDAYRDLLLLFNNHLPSVPAVLHFYTGRPKITKELAGKGFYFTFGGAITFSSDYNETIKYIPDDRVLLETDCPYVAPESQRGKRNEPVFIIEVAQRMAELKNLSFNLLIEKLSGNIKTAFGIEA